MSKEVSNYQAFMTSPNTTTSGTSSTTVNTAWLPNINNWAIGFERQWDMLSQLRTTLPSGSSYPPYNIIKVDEDEYRVEMALAGFNRKELTVVQQEQTLTVTGDKVKDLDSTYIHKGIGARSFSHTFALSDYVEVESADFSDGILSIILRRELPEEKKPRTITVK